MLKEVNASANVVCEDAGQVVDTLAYVIRGILPPTPRDGDKFVPIADRLGKGNNNPLNLYLLLIHFFNTIALLPSKSP